MIRIESTRNIRAMASTCQTQVLFYSLFEKIVPFEPAVCDKDILPLDNTLIYYLGKDFADQVIIAIDGSSFKHAIAAADFTVLRYVYLFRRKVVASHQAADRARLASGRRILQHTRQIIIILEMQCFAFSVYILILHCQCYARICAYAL